MRPVAFTKYACADSLTEGDLWAQTSRLGLIYSISVIVFPCVPVLSRVTVTVTVTVNYRSDGLKKSLTSIVSSVGVVFAEGSEERAT